MSESLRDTSQSGQQSGGASESTPALDPRSWPEITDEAMTALKSLPRPYTVLILKAGPNLSRDADGMKVITAHGRRNLSMRAAGLLPIICPIPDGGEVTGVGIFNTGDPAVVRAVMADDPGVKAGFFTFEVHATRII